MGRACTRGDRGRFEQTFQIVVVVFIQTANGKQFLGAPQSAFDITVFRADPGFIILFTIYLQIFTIPPGCESDGDFFANKVLQFECLAAACDLNNTFVYCLFSLSHPSRSHKNIEIQMPETTDLLARSNLFPRKSFVQVCGGHDPTV
jgi:hypothetical protein